MPVSRLFKLATGSFLALQLLLPTNALAHGPTECTSGPTRLASPDAPALVDAEADTSEFGTVHGKAGDVIGAWITGPSAWADRAAPQKFVGHIRLEGLDKPPVFARYYLVYPGKGGERWVRAVFEAPDTWTFHYGTYEGTTYTQNGTTTGSVNMSTGIISIDLPSDTIPNRPANGTQLSLVITAARSYLRHEPVPGGLVGNLRLMDEGLGGDCDVMLYEAAPTP